MQAGKLNQRIDIIEAVRTQDTTGDVVIDWQVKELSLIHISEPTRPY